MKKVKYETENTDNDEKRLRGMVYGRMIMENVDIGSTYTNLTDVSVRKFGDEVLGIEGEESKANNQVMECFIFMFGAVVFWFSPCYQPSARQYFMDKIILEIRRIHNLGTFNALSNSIILSKEQIDTSQDQQRLERVSSYRDIEAPDMARDMEDLKPRRRKKNKPLEILHNCVEDDLTFCLDEDLGKSYLKKDLIMLTTTKVHQRLAYSYAFAQSLILSKYEDEVEIFIGDNRWIPEKLRMKGSTGIEMKELSIRMGTLYKFRCDINLISDILDTPEVFWECDEFEREYQQARDYLTIVERTSILNSRLDIIKDMYDLLINELNVRHSNYLEYIIVILILAEVILELFNIWYGS